MPSHSLRYQSRSQSVKLEGEDLPHSASIGSWQIWEAFDTTIPTFARKGIGSYSLVLETQVETQPEIRNALDSATRIAKEIDTAWCYVFDRPLNSLAFDVVMVEAPDGWTGNGRQVEIEIQKSKGIGYAEAIHVSMSHTAVFPFLPLKKVLAARDKILTASEELLALIDLHVLSHKSSGGALFFRSKGLELAASLFNNREELQGELDKMGVSCHLGKNVRELFMLANTRYETRHIVDKKSQLHPKMTSLERNIFLTDIDIIMRAVVCLKLDIDLTIFIQKQNTRASKNAPKAIS